HRTTQNEAVAHDNWMGQAAGIPPLVIEPEAELEVLRLPGVRARSARDLLDPDPEIAANLTHLVAPHSGDGRRERLLVLCGDAVEDRIERAGRVLDSGCEHGKSALGFHLTVELRLRGVKQAPPRQGIHPDERFGLVPWLEAVDCREQKLIRAAREAL